MELKFLKIMI